VCFGYFELASCYISLIVIRRSEFPCPPTLPPASYIGQLFRKPFVWKNAARNKQPQCSPPILCVSDISHTGYFSVQNAGVLVK